MSESVPCAENGRRIFEYFPSTSDLGVVALIAPMMLVAFAIWLAVRIANRREPLAPECLRKLGATALVVAVPWWLLVVIVSLTHSWLLGGFSEMYLSVLNGLRQW